MSEPQKLRIDIWSDIMCPWCLIGWGNLSQALDQLKGEIEPEIHWHAFELNPDMPSVGEERTAHIARKYGRSMEIRARCRTRCAMPPRLLAYRLIMTGRTPNRRR